MSDDQCACTIYYWGADAHDGPGFYYVDDEYPDEGSCGAFKRLEDARRHAAWSGYTVVDCDESARAEAAKGGADG